MWQAYVARLLCSYILVDVLVIRDVEYLALCGISVIICLFNNCSTNRSFSKLKVLKSYLCSTVTQQRFVIWPNSRVTCWTKLNITKHSVWTSTTRCSDQSNQDSVIICLFNQVANIFEHLLLLILRTMKFERLSPVSLSVRLPFPSKWQSLNAEPRIYDHFQSINNLTEPLYYNGWCNLIYNTAGLNIPFYLISPLT